MTIDEVVRASMSLHLSYGKYVETYRPGLDKPHTEPERVCKRCGADISDRVSAAKYCLDCSCDMMDEHQDWLKRKKKNKM